MSQEPISRPASRVLLIDSADRILLMQHRGEDVAFVWAPPGGAIEPGETPEQAAIRELREEIGLLLEAVGPCVWLRQHLFHWQGEVYDVRERFFVCRIDAYDAGEHVNEDEIERQFMMGHRWWSLSELAVSSEVFVPRDLATLLRPILNHEYPDEPFEVGT